MADQPAPTGQNTPASPERRPPGLRVGRVRGVPIYLSPLALVFAVLVATLVYTPEHDRPPGSSAGPLQLPAAVAAVGFVLSLVLHELGHALTALGFRLRVRSVTIHGF